MSYISNVKKVSFKTTRHASRSAYSVGVAAVLHFPYVAQNTTDMKRQSAYAYTTTEPPGATVHALRTAHGWSMRALADRCHPPLDHTTIRRLENNLGYTQDTLERVAKALSVNVYDLFLPPEMAIVPTLPEDIQNRISENIKDTVAAWQNRKK